MRIVSDGAHRPDVTNNARQISDQGKEYPQRGSIYLPAEIHKAKTLTLRKIFMKPVFTCLFIAWNGLKSMPQQNV